MKIIGYQLSKGEYQGRPYQHYKLYFTSLIEKNGSGYSCDIVKVPVTVFNDFIKSYIPSGDLNKIINMSVEVAYNKYGQVQKLYIDK